MTRPVAAARDRQERERRLEQHALEERLRRAARRPLEENLAAGLALIETTQAFRTAFRPSPKDS